VVERLAAAGAILVGKTGLHEFAYGITSNNPHFGAVRNPWNPECVPGGSSGGSGAAVAANMAFMAMGTDTGGSIRIPASYCGAVGLKPTFGRVSRYGVLPLDFSLDHMGPLTRSVRDAALTLNAIAGQDHRDDTSSRRPVVDYLPGERLSLRGVRVGVPENYFFDRIDPDVDRAVRGMVSKAEELGAEIVAVRVPDVAALNAVGRVILLAEASSVLGQYADKRDQIGADVLALFDQGRLIAGTDYVNAQRLRRMFQREFAKVWEQADVLFTPTTPTSAPRIGQTTTTIDGHTEDVRLMATKFLRGINVLGWPALAMPCGLDSAGMPVSLQILGKPFEEARILRVGAALEDASGPYPAPPLNFL
jgi:aspartyl-tRNA(Asn)/glutamyl-tRNA(Gln) amidotransferase subunit A